MNDLQGVKLILMSRSADLTKKIREWEDLCRKFGVDPSGDRAYTVITAHRDAINNILQEIMASHETSSTSGQQRY